MNELSATVLLVDDFGPFRAIVSSLLGERPELQILAEASDGIEAVQKCAQLQPDVILLDIGLPKLNGIDAARQIREVSPQSKIIFLSQESCADLVQEALSLGARGYVTKNRVRSELLRAIEVVLEGRQFVGAGLVDNSESSKE